MEAIRWYLQLLLELFEAALRHLREGPQRAATLAQANRVRSELAALDQAEAETVAEAKPRGKKAAPSDPQGDA